MITANKPGWLRGLPGALSALHNKTIVSHNPTDMAAEHNLALAYSELSLPITSVDHYRNAFALGETLSASNLGYKFVDAGFQTECETLLREALAKPNCIPEVQQALGTVNRRLQDEGEKLEEHLRNAERRRDFMVRLGEGMITPAPIDVEGIWELDFGPVSFLVGGGELIGTGEKVLSGGNALALRSLLAGSTSPSAKTRQTLSLKGELLGRACKYVVTVRSLTEPSSFPDITCTNGYMLFDSSMHGAEIVPMKDGKIQEITRIEKKRDAATPPAP
jgi:hypothetical protein